MEKAQKRISDSDFIANIISATRLRGVETIHIDTYRWHAAFADVFPSFRREAESLGYTVSFRVICMSPHGYSQTVSLMMQVAIGAFGLASVEMPQGNLLRIKISENAAAQILNEDCALRPIYEKTARHLLARYWSEEA